MLNNGKYHWNYWNKAYMNFGSLREASSSELYLFRVYFPILKLNYPLIKYKFPTLHLNFPLLDFEYPTFQFDFPELHFMVPFLQSDHPNLRFNFPVMRNQLSTIWIQISSFRDEFSNTIRWIFHNWNSILNIYFSYFHVCIFH